MARFEYDEESSAAWHMDVVHEVPEDKPVPVARWVQSMRRLNTVEDPLGRRLVALHRDCGSGSGVCDGPDDEPVPISQRSGWGCGTTEAIAAHFNIPYPEPPSGSDQASVHG